MYTKYQNVPEKNMEGVEFLIQALFRITNGGKYKHISSFFFDTIITNVHVININVCVLSCQPRVTVTSCFVYKVIRDLESIDHLCINPIRMIGFIHKRSIDSRKLKLSVHVSVYLAIVNKALRHCHSWLARQYVYAKFDDFRPLKEKIKCFR